MLRNDSNYSNEKSNCNAKSKYFEYNMGQNFVEIIVLILRQRLLVNCRIYNKASFNVYGRYVIHQLY